MNDVGNYIDKLFAKYPKTNETLELKYEFGGIFIAYAILAITVIVPILVNKPQKMLEQQKEGIFDEA